MQKFLDKYNEKKGPLDPVMPGTEEGVPCPCFNEEDLNVLGDAGKAFACAVSTFGTGLDLALYQDGVFQFGTDELGCFKYDSSVGDFIDLGTSDEENEECRRIILEAIERDFVVEDCQEGDS